MECTKKEHKRNEYEKKDRKDIKACGSGDVLKKAKEKDMKKKRKEKGLNIMKRKGIEEIK